MDQGYEPLRIETKWQAKWDAAKAARVDLDAARRPFYNLMMFPYPSAEGLHVGNVYAFTGADIHGRFQRLRGFDVFEPIGFDAFGIHTENFALKRGIHPARLIPDNIANFTQQLKRMGFYYDWSHTVDTTDPGYYRWTQWIFLKLFHAGIATLRKAPVNWCPSCKTVLANEQVVEGACERCDTLVKQRVLQQWFFEITRYAERLLGNLDHIDWSDTTRRLQRNWIGRSTGLDVRFPVEKQESRTVTVFTTRPETIFGATFLVLAPDHPLVAEITGEAQRPAVEAFVASTSAIDLVERRKRSETATKSGVFTGATAVNPATGESIPIFISDYVLMDYARGAIMGVPAHDARDLDFARLHGLPVREVIAGGDPAADPVAVGEPPPDARLVNSGEFTGEPLTEGAARIAAWLIRRGSAAASTQFRMHDWCISRQRYWGPPIPIVHCERCGAVPVPEDQLPVLLPHVENFVPDESGRGPLARDEAFVSVACPKCGAPARRDTDVSDTFLDSAWYFLRYPSTDSPQAPFRPDRTGKWLPVDMYIGGEEHAVLHLMYARFITMVLSDLGHLEFEEPFKKFRKHGLILRDGAKMSKSRGNVVNPDEYVRHYGADTLRAYLMFLGPYDQGGDFSDAGISGVHRFLARVWDTVVAAEEGGGDAEIECETHRTIKIVTEDIAGLQFNTALAALMKYLNVIRAHGRRARRPEVEPLVVLLAPFAPHLAEELWERLGHAESLFSAARWPAYDADKIRTETVAMVVQVNGKHRTTLTVQRGLGQDEVLSLAKADEKVSRAIGERALRSVVFLKDKLINLVA